MTSETSKISCLRSHFLLPSFLLDSYFVATVTLAVTITATTFVVIANVTANIVS